VRKAMYDAKEYMERTIQNGAPPPDPGKEVLVRVLKQQLTVCTTARSEQDIRTALRLAEEFGYHTVIDEAQEFIPQDARKGDNAYESSRAVERLLRHGRKYNLFCWVSTQRIAHLNTNALQQLHRVSGANLLLAVGTLLAIGGLLAAVGSPAQLAAATRHARWNWLAAAFAISMSTTIAYTLALLGTVTQRLPLWPTIELQVGLALSNVAVPLGGTAMQVRYLQHHGSDLPSAIAAGGLLSTVGSAVAQTPPPPSGAAARATSTRRTTTTRTR